MRGGTGPALRLWTASELRRRWASLVILGLLAGAASGLAIAAFDGAARSGTAYTRMRQQLAAADVVFYPSQVGAGDVDVTKLGTLGEVEAWAGFALNNSNIDEPPGGSPIIAVGDGWFDTIERAKVLEGRLPDPAADDEAVIDVAATKLGENVRVGSVFTWRSLSVEDNERFPEGVPVGFDWTTATGPVTKLRIVGIVRLPMQPVTSFAAGGLLITGPGWAAAHLDETGVFFTNALVRLKNGAADVPKFKAGVSQLYGRDDLPVKDLSVDIKRVQRSVELEQTALRLFGGAVVAAALVLVGQSLLRSVRAGATGLPVLRAMGLGRASLYAGLVAPHLLTVAVALIVAAVTGAVLSARFPIGLARQLDPDLGVHVDALPFVFALALAAASLLLGTEVLAIITTRGLTRQRSLHRNQLVSVATRAGLPIPPAVGTSLALEQAPAQNSTVRPALLAAIVGVIAVVGATTLAGGIDDALREPARVGTVWDLEATSDDVADLPTLLSLAPSPDIDGMGVVSRWPSVVENIDAPIYAVFDGSGKAVRYVPLKGRGPLADDEVALGPRTASTIDSGVGDTVAVGPDKRPMRVVGISLFQQTPHSSFDEGAWVTPKIMDEMSGLTLNDRDGAVLIRLHPGADRDAVMASLSESYFTETPSVVPDVENLANVRRLPLSLAAFLVLLAIGAVGHALLTGARHRAHDLAVLRALGITPRQAAACVSWQATIIGVIALVIGVPAGLIVGRAVWRLTADSLSFVYVGPLSTAAMVLVVPGALLVCWLLAIWPARAAGRRPAAEVLRAE
ncbi:MAG TPA: ABC transporter permease [Acidimicrobiales bacterium]|nr:ABC transporter permease [Acidimicrobiales bacterium]